MAPPGLFPADYFSECHLSLLDWTSQLLRLSLSRSFIVPCVHSASLLLVNAHHHKAAVYDWISMMLNMISIHLYNTIAMLLNVMRG